MLFDTVTHMQRQLLGKNVPVRKTNRPFSEDEVLGVFRPEFFS